MVDKNFVKLKGKLLYQAMLCESKSLVVEKSNPKQSIVLKQRALDLRYKANTLIKKTYRMVI